VGGTRGGGRKEVMVKEGVREGESWGMREGGEVGGWGSRGERKKRKREKKG